MIKHFKYNNLGNHDYGWLNARYHFNFANYFNPLVKTRPPLLVWNDDTIKPKTGFPMHSHQNMEIITYVRKGSITHMDDIGNKGEIRAGQIQIMSAGSGINHSEYNHSEEDTSLFQIWIEPNEKNIKPRWENITLSENNVENFTILASGEKRFDKLNTLKINQDVSLIKVNGEDGISNYKINKNRHIYFVISKGNAMINGFKISKGDGVYIFNENKNFNEDEIKFKFFEKTEIIMVDMPFTNN